MVAVLQATIITLAPLLIKNSVFFILLSIIYSCPFLPYGDFLESEYYIVVSCGINLLISFQIERPPAPESKMPMGFELIL